LGRNSAAVEIKDEVLVCITRQNNRFPEEAECTHIVSKISLFDYRSYWGDIETFTVAHFIYLPWYLHCTPFMKSRHYYERDQKMSINIQWLMNEPWANCSDDLTGSGADDHLA